MNSIRSLFGLCLLLTALYLGWQIIPAYVANYRLEEVINDAAHELNGVYPLSEEQVRSRVVSDARAMDIPLTADQVEVHRIRQEGVVWADYTVHVDLPLHPLDLHFQPESRNRKSAGQP